MLCGRVPAGTWPWYLLCPVVPTGSSSQRCPQKTAGRTICAGGWRMYESLVLVVFPASHLPKIFIFFNLISYFMCFFPFCYYSKGPEAPV